MVMGLVPRPLWFLKKKMLLPCALGAFAGLDPLAHPRALVQSLDKADGAFRGVGAVVLAHDGLDGLGGLVGVVEGDGADVVVQDVGLDDAVEEVAADEAELAVNRGSGTADKVPLVRRVMGKRRVGVLEVGNRH